MKCNIISLGCPKNLVESEEIIGTLGAAGCEIAVLPEDADIMIINTCGFIEPAIEETKHEIANALTIAQKTGARLFVYGCAVNRCKQVLQSLFPEVIHWYRIDQQSEMIDMIMQTRITTTSRLVTTPGYAYLKIADGCSNKCAYCTIPDIRGPFHSIPQPYIVNQAQELADVGIKEVILVAQDITQYGVDVYGKPCLTDLIRSISAIDGISWIRLLYAHPRGITDELIQEIGTNDRVCNYLDVPIQHINDRLLHIMHRKTSRQHIETSFSRLQDIKGISIRTTVIAGLPTENDKEFMELIDFLQHSPVTWLGVFSYHPEPGTRAAIMDQHDPVTVDERYTQLIQLQHDLLMKHYEQLLGKTHTVMVHGRNSHYCGHSEHSCPEIDDPILIDAPHLEYGCFYQARFDHFDKEQMYAEVSATL